MYQGVIYTYSRKRFTQYLHNTIKFVPAIYSVYQHNLNPNLECNNYCKICDKFSWLLHHCSILCQFHLFAFQMTCCMLSFCWEIKEYCFDKRSHNFLDNGKRTFLFWKLVRQCFEMQILTGLETRMKIGITVCLTKLEWQLV